MADLNGLSITFSAVLKELQLEFLGGNKVNFSEVDYLLHRLQSSNLNMLHSDDQKKAFWINVYNGLTNYIIVKKGIKRTIICNMHLLSTFKIDIDDYQWSLNQIEHGILRRNSKPPYHIRIPFNAGDPRRKHMLVHKDERIHFALNYGGNSCPAVRFYSAQDINEELELAKKSFLEKNLSVDYENKIISCSPLFKWYRKDFEGKYIFDKLYKEFAIRYNSYSWSVDMRPS